MRKTSEREERYYTPGDGVIRENSADEESGASGTTETGEDIPTPEWEGTSFGSPLYRLTGRQQQNQNDTTLVGSDESKDPQAIVLDTSSDEESEEMSKRKRGSTGSTPEGTEKEGKRIKAEYTDQEKAMKELEESIKMIEEKVDSLVELVKRNQNTKVEIKNGIRGMEQLTRRTKIRLEEVRKLTTTLDKSAKEAAKPVTSKAGTQTDAWHNGVRTLREEDLKDINELSELTSIENLIWPDDVYTNSKVIVGDPLGTEDGTVRVVMVEPKDPDMQASIQKMFKDKYPELADLTDPFEVWY